MTLNFTERMGFLREVTEAMVKNAETLKEAGFDVDSHLTDQTAKNDKVASSTAEQDVLKARLYKQTKNLNSAMRAAYVAASSRLDAMSGILSKDSEISKVLRRIRSKVKMANRTQNELKVAA